jgi:carboxymethylenebutenolidase
MQTACSLRGANRMGGMVGYCLGGLMTFLTTERKGADASVVYSGGNTVKHLDEADKIRSPLLIHLGEYDEYIPRNAQKAIVGALKDNPCARIFTYPAAVTLSPGIAASIMSKTAAALAKWAGGRLLPNAP